MSNNHSPPISVSKSALICFDRTYVIRGESQDKIKAESKTFFFVDIITHYFGGVCVYIYMFDYLLNGFGLEFTV